MSKVVSIRKKSPGIEIKNKSGDISEIYLYGVIGDGGWLEEGITAKDFAEAIKTIPESAKEIHVRINSPGGDVWTGYSIFNKLKQSKKKIVCYVDGIAASIASIIAMAGDEVIMGEASQMMIHQAWTIAAGNANDFESVIQRLNDIDQQLVSIYVKKTGLSRTEIEKMMSEETWMLGQEAVDQGFADSIAADTMPIAASIMDKAKWINRLPKNIVLETDVIKKNVQDIQNKINKFLKK